MNRWFMIPSFCLLQSYQVSRIMPDVTHFEGLKTLSCTMQARFWKNAIHYGTTMYISYTLTRAASHENVTHSWSLNLVSNTASWYYSIGTQTIHEGNYLWVIGPLKGRYFTDTTSDLCIVPSTAQNIPMCWPPSPTMHHTTLMLRECITRNPSMYAFTEIENTLQQWY